MKYDADFITHKIQMIVGLTAKVQIPPSELEWLLTLEDDYLELGIKQAALNQLRYFDIKPVQQEMLLKQIEERSRQIVMQQKWKEAPMVSYDDYIDMSELACDNHKHEVPSWDNVKTFVHDQKEPFKNDVHYRLTLGVNKPSQIELPEAVGRRFRGVK